MCIRDRIRRHSAEDCVGGDVRRVGFQRIIILVLLQHCVDLADASIVITMFGDLKTTGRGTSSSGRGGRCVDGIHDAPLSFAFMGILA